MQTFSITKNDDGSWLAGPTTESSPESAGATTPPMGEPTPPGNPPAGGAGAPMMPGGNVEMGGPGGAEGSEQAGMSPVKDLEAALQVARDFFTNPQAQAAQNDEGMWNKVQADRAMASQPGGPMMGVR